MDRHNLKLKRHETFSIREGWLEKGLNRIAENSKCFSKGEGVKILGLGTNMVKSLHYWLVATNIAEFNNASGAILTEFGKLLLTKDRFLDNITSWWLIHYFLVTNLQEAVVFNIFFNLETTKFEKESLVNQIEGILASEYSDIKRSSLESDVAILLKSYIETSVDDPENNLNCPLSKLGLLKVDNNKIYIKTCPNLSLLSEKVIMKCLSDYIEEKSDTFNVEDLIKSVNNPLRIFNISKSTLFLYLDKLRKQGYLTLVKTAGLNTVRILRKISLDELYIE